MVFGSEPPLRRLANRFERSPSKLRNRVGNLLEKEIVDFGSERFGNGEAVGIIGAGIIVILEDTVGIPFGADADIVNAEVVGDGEVVYTVDVNAPTKNIAEMRAFLDSTTGFTSILVDEFDIQEAEVLNFRPLRDTYEVKVKVVD